MHEAGATGSVEIGGNRGNGKKKKSEDSASLPVVEVSKKSKTSSLGALNKKSLLGQGSSADQQLSFSSKKLEVVKSSVPATREPEVKSDTTKLELEAAGAIAGLKLKKAGKKT